MLRMGEESRSESKLSRKLLGSKDMLKLIALELREVMEGKREVKHCGRAQLMAFGGERLWSVVDLRDSESRFGSVRRVQLSP